MFLAYAALSACACWLAWEQTAGSDKRVEDFMKVASVYLAVLTSLLAALITFVNINRQGVVSRNIEEMKAWLAQELTVHNILASVESQAFEGLLKAMTRYYHTLALAERGICDRERIDSADDKMIRVAHLSSRLQRPCEEAFNGFWQRARNVNDSFRRLAATEKDPQQFEAKVQQVWTDNIKGLGAAFEWFENECKRHHAIARRENK